MSEVVRVKIGKISQVLLVDGWHIVKPGTFDVGEIAFVNDDGTLKGHIGRPQAIQWTDGDSGLQTTCHLSAVQAIRAN